MAKQRLITLALPIVWMHLAKSNSQGHSEVQRIDRERETFHHRYWPERALLPEIFTITLNAEQIDEEQIVDCIVPLIRISRQSVGAMHQRVEVGHENQ